MFGAGAGRGRGGPLYLASTSMLFSIFMTSDHILAIHGDKYFYDVGA